ncbi:hypothetical protein ACJX0J_028714, partial [Zea mays]
IWEFYPRTNKILNPTFHFLHCWVGISLLPHAIVRPLRNDHLILLHAIVHIICSWTIDMTKEDYFSKAHMLMKGP